MSFDLSRLTRADRIIGGSAVAFFIFLFFFHWYGGSSNTPLGSESIGYSGWKTFSNSRWIWLITIIVAVVAVVRASGALKFDTPVQLSVAVAGLGALSVLTILYRIIHHPHGGVSATVIGVHYSASYGIKFGIWLGLLAAIGVTYGGYLAMKDEGTSIADVREQASGALSSFQGGSGDASAPASGEPAATPAPPAAEAPAPPIPPPAVDPGPEPAA